MFERGIIEEVQANFSMADFPTLSFYFGEAPQSTSAPYGVMFVLDSNGDPQTLCDEQFDAGDSFIQFNVYAESPIDSFRIKQALSEFLTTFRTLTVGSQEYIINRTTHGSSPSSQTLTNGLSVDVLAKTFNYEKA